MVFSRKECLHSAMHLTLFELCSAYVFQNVTELQKMLEHLPHDHKKIVMNLLPLNIPLDISLPLMHDESYWKRKCLEQGWNSVDYWLCKCSWKKAFIFRFVENFIDSFISGKLSILKLESNLKPFQDFCQKLKINGFKWYSFDNAKCNLVDQNIFELQFSKMFLLLQNLKELTINISPENLENYDEANSLGDTYLFIILKHMPKLSNLEKITITGSCVGQNRISQLISNPCLNTLVELNLSCCFISDNCCEFLAQFLVTSKLQKLILSNNNIGSLGIQKIALSLHENTPLNLLDLRKNCIEDDGIKDLVESLKFNTFLRNLDLSYNQLSNSCGPALSSLIINNSILRNLSLSGNCLGEETGCKIAQSLQENKSIIFINVQFCGFRMQDEDAISLAVLKNVERKNHF